MRVFTGRKQLYESLTGGRSRKQMIVASCVHALRLRLRRDTATEVGRPRAAGLRLGASQAVRDGVQTRGAQLAPYAAGCAPS